MPWSFFNKAYQGNHNECGIGMIIHLSPGFFSKLKLRIGRGTKTKAKLLALWGLLFFCKIKRYWENKSGWIFLGDYELV